MSRLISSLSFLLFTTLSIAHTSSHTPSNTPSIYFTLQPLPYPIDSLEPFLSAVTVATHHTKHQAGYVNKLNEVLNSRESKYQELEKPTLEELIGIKPKLNTIYNMAAQIYNHQFFWKSMSPKKNNPSGKLVNSIILKYDSFDNFKNQFIQIATNHFGSGWVWFVERIYLTGQSPELEIIATHDAECVISYDNNHSKVKPLLVIDVWEHSYYLDYKNLRADYVKGWWEHVNWDFAEQNFVIDKNYDEL